MNSKTYLITASSGIGAETARLLGEKGGQIFLVSNNAQDLKALGEKLEKQSIPVDFFAVDLTNLEGPRSAVEKCIQRFGRIDGLFNVAGVSARKQGDGPLHECTEEGWEMALQFNLTTQYRMTREVLKVMLDQDVDVNSGQRGVILNMSSILGIHPEPDYFSAIGYATSKGAIAAMTRSAAAFYARKKIRMNAIAPALVRTAMSSRASEDPQIIRFIEEKQILTDGMIPVLDVAETCVFLLTEASRSITGEVIEVDGGWNLH